MSKTSIIIVLLLICSIGIAISEADQPNVRIKGNVKVTNMQESELIGVSLIDQFAMAALPAIIGHHSKVGEYNYKDVSQHAYSIAEHMMKQRLERTESRYGKKKGQ